MPNDAAPIAAGWSGDIRFEGSKKGDNVSTWFDQNEFITSRKAHERLGWTPRFANLQLSHWLHRVRARTLLLWGDNDRYAPADCSVIFAREIAGAHGCMAGMRACEALDEVVLRGRGALADAIEHVTQQVPRILDAQSRGHALDDHGGRAHRREVPAELAEHRAELEQQLVLRTREVDQDREQQALRGPLLTEQSGLGLLVQDALVRGMHIHHHQSLLVLRKDINPCQLSESISKR